MAAGRLKIFAVSVCLAMLFSGCETSRKLSKGPAYDLALKFEANDTAVYCVTIERGNTHQFDQPGENKSEKQQRWSRNAVTFSQRIIDIDNEGNAVAEIVIKSLKYSSKGMKDDVGLDFDSQRQSDAGQPLMKLIDSSYKIRITPAGAVEVIDTAKARSALTGKSRPILVAKDLLSDDSIKARHGFASVLPPPGSSRVKQQSQWTHQQDSPVRMLMEKTYEKSFIFDKVEQRNSRNIAVVDMNAAAVSSQASEGAAGFAMFAAVMTVKEPADTFKGCLEFDLDTGRVEKYTESLLSEIVFEDNSKKTQDTSPDQLTLGSQYTYTAELIE
ncbi:MAG: hypothetical protein ABIG61_11700 [Planctomycetota bacterium]